ncbi:hypothetical protein A471_23078 [Ectopseudomonas mendocina DLHK]|nr:hypothetical protein A471_23078 [Pseudomonas mendocina DLHK]
MRHELDNLGYFICDLPEGGYAEHWTDDPVPQPIGVPRYVGASYNPPTGEWFAGRWVDEAEPVPVQVPEVVTMRQARLALHAAGLLDQVDPAIDQLPEPARTAARIEWEYSQVVRRDKPFVMAIGGALGLGAAQIDDLFITAAGIE